MTQSALYFGAEDTKKLVPYRPEQLMEEEECVEFCAVILPPAFPQLLKELSSEL